MAPVHDTRAREAFKATRLCTGLREEELRDLLDISELAEAGPGGVLVREGEPGDGLYLLVEGEVELSKRDPEGRPHVVLTLQPGAVFGEASLLADNRSSATATARSAVKLVRMPCEGFAELMVREHLGALKLVRNLATSLYSKLAGVKELLLSSKVDGGSRPRGELADFREKLLVDWGF